MLLHVAQRVTACCPAGYPALHCTSFDMLLHEISISMYVTRRATQHYTAHYQKTLKHVTQHVTACHPAQYRMVSAAYLEWRLLRGIICLPP